MGLEYGLIAIDGRGNPVAASARDVVTLYALRRDTEDRDFLSA